MSIIYEKIEDIQNILREAAENRTTVSYKQIYDVFGNAPQSDVWDTFEHSSNQLCDGNVAILDCLMSTRDGYPALGFFDKFRTRRYDIFINIAGNVGSAGLTTEQKQEITRIERNRVYDFFAERRNL